MPLSVTSAGAGTRIEPGLYHGVILGHWLGQSRRGWPLVTFRVVALGRVTAGGELAPVVPVVARVYKAITPWSRPHVERELRALGLSDGNLARLQPGGFFFGGRAVGLACTLGFDVEGKKQPWWNMTPPRGDSRAQELVFKAVGGRVL